MDIANTAIAIKIGERYFLRIGKGGRIQTAWSLAGAKLFGPWMEEDITTIEKKLINKNKKCYRIFVECKMEVK